MLLRGRFNPQLFNISVEPSRIRWEELYLPSTLLMSAFSLQRRPDNETLSFNRFECSSTQSSSNYTTSWRSFGELSRPANFRRKDSCLDVLDGRLLSCYTFINRLPLPSTLHSCIRTLTSLLSLNSSLGTLTYAHGCFRLDYPPYHEQSEIS
jgi:hypothetical protein